MPAAALAEGGQLPDEGGPLAVDGNCYAELGQNGQAIDYYEQALAIAREVGDRASEAANLNNLGNRCSDLGQTVRAIEFYKQALAIDCEIEDRPGQALDLCNLGNRYADLGQTAAALQCYKDALRTSVVRRPCTDYCFRTRAYLRMCSVETAATASINTSRSRS
jgi:tetratricopeptide (TPR) repeat protein